MSSVVLNQEILALHARVTILRCDWRILIVRRGAAWRDLVRRGLVRPGAAWRDLVRRGLAQVFRALSRR